MTLQCEHDWLSLTTNVLAFSRHLRNRKLHKSAYNRLKPESDDVSLAASDSRTRSRLICTTWIIECETSESQAKHVCYILWQTLMYDVCSTTILLEVCYALQNIERYKQCRITFFQSEQFFSRRRRYHIVSTKTVVNAKGFTIHSMPPSVFPTLSLSYGNSFLA